MKKDKAWLKDLINEEGIVMNRNYIKINKGRLFYLIDQLVESEVKQLNRKIKKIKELESYNDKLIRDNNQLKNERDNQEVLSQAWIDEYAHGDCDEWVYTEDLQNLLVPKQDKPVIPQFVADYIEKWKYADIALGTWFTFNYESMEDNEVSKWLYDNTAEEKSRREYLLISAVLNDYKVEKEPLYFAKIKGHELVQRIPTFDEDTGENTSDYYRSVYFVLQSDGDLIVDMKERGFSGAKNVMTMSQWNDLGVNETNADFEDVVQ